MRINRLLAIVAFCAWLVTGCCPKSSSLSDGDAPEAGWEDRLETMLPLLGHRNWIVITDMAYPLQSGQGITTIYADQPYLEVLKTVNEKIKAAPHVFAHVYNDKELEYAKKAVAFYKEIRPVVQQGDLYRLLSPYDNRGFCSEMFVTEDKGEAVFFCYKFENYVGLETPRWHMAGLDPEATYRISEFECPERNNRLEGKTFTGRFLMETGIELRLNGQFASRIIRMKKQ